MRREKAEKIREMIEKAAVSLTDEDALEATELFPVWAIGVTYADGKRIRYSGKLYRVVQTHTSQIDWLPDSTPALYVEVAEPGEIPVWRQPTGAHDVYNKGDKVHYPGDGDPVYESDIDNNSWPPAGAGAYGWHLV